MRKTWIHDINASPEGKGEGKTGVNLGEGCRGCTPPPRPRDDLRFSNTTGILQKKRTMWFIGVEVEQETSAPPPKKEFLTRVVDVIADIFYSPQQLVPRQYKLILE